MAYRRDGRIEPGQPLKTAISATAWNRAQDAADIVLGQRPGFGAEGKLPSTLPRLEAVFVPYSSTTAISSVGYGAAATVKNPFGQYQSSDLLAQPQVPFDDTTAEAFSAEESALPNRSILQVVLTVAQPAIPLNEEDVVICSDPPRKWVYSGYAITRIRVFNYRHQFARPPVQCGLDDENAAGCLDSCNFSRVRIAGYLRNEGTGFASSAPVQVNQSPFVYPNHEFRWAIVRL